MPDLAMGLHCVQAIRQAQERKKDSGDARFGLLFLSKRNAAAEDPAVVQVRQCSHALSACPWPGHRLNQRIACMCFIWLPRCAKAGC
jgi:hypothetical protein